MAILATSARRRLAMAVLLAAGAIGAVIRHQAPDPGTLRDVGTLMMVLWVPAVGNLVAFLVQKIPRRALQRTAFEPGSPFVAHLQARLERMPVTDAFTASLDPSDDRATLVATRHGFTVRLQQPVAQWLREPSAATVPMECLSPKLALRVLGPGASVHLLVGSTAIAKGVIA